MDPLDGIIKTFPKKVPRDCSLSVTPLCPFHHSNAQYDISISPSLTGVTGSSALFNTVDICFKIWLYVFTSTHLLTGTLSIFLIVPIRVIYVANIYALRYNCFYLCV